MALQNISMHVEDLVREMRRLVLDQTQDQTQDITQFGNANAAARARQRREERLVEIKEELDRIRKIVE
jgi:hypothetical protein